MTTETYDEIVGSVDTSAYAVAGAILRPCSNCGAPEGVRCTVEQSGRLVGRRFRRMPCLARLRGGEAR